MLDVSIVMREKVNKKGRRANVKRIFKSAHFDIIYEEEEEEISISVFWCVVTSLGPHLVYSWLGAERLQNAFKRKTILHGSVTME